jgi:hypothetical protein
LALANELFEEFMSKKNEPAEEKNQSAVTSSAEK